MPKDTEKLPENSDQKHKNLCKHRYHVIGLIRMGFYSSESSWICYYFNFVVLCVREVLELTGLDMQLISH